MIDRMVEDSIRRILPEVMNEILVRTLAGSGALSESPQATRKKAPRPEKVGRPAPVKRQAGQPKPLSKRKIKESLAGLLDESAGTEFYDDPYGAMQDSAPKQEDYTVEDDGEDYQLPATRAPARANPAKHLAPALQQLAEGMSLVEDDEDAMWDGPSGDSAVAKVDSAPIDRAVQAMGQLGAPIDFNRMKSMIQKTSPAKPKADAEDRRAQAQFEVARIKRMREQLNGGKPIE